MSKIGIMGGTFNPIHLGHLILAENAYEQLHLEKVLFMPSKNPPHKAKPELAAEQQRVDMIELAISSNPHFELSTIELTRDGLTYTADTLALLKQENPDVNYYFIVGADSLFMMHKWKDPQIVFSHCTIVAAGRDHALEADIQQQIQFLREHFHAEIIRAAMPTIQIASGEIRDRIAAGKSVRYYIPDSVTNYIEANQLYFNRQEVISQ